MDLRRKAFWSGTLDNWPARVSLLIFLATMSGTLLTISFNDKRGTVMELNKDLTETTHALPTTNRQNLIEWYCKLQLRAYRSVFKPNEEVSALDNTSRRYAWLKRLLKIHDEEHAHIFPASWDVSRILCLQFCQITR